MEFLVAVVVACEQVAGGVSTETSSEEVRSVSRLDPEKTSIPAWPSPEVSQDFPRRDTSFYGDKILYKILILPKILPTRFCFTFYGNRILYKNLPRF